MRPFASDAALLPAAEGRGGIGDEAAIEAHHAGFEALGDAQPAPDIPRVDVGHEAHLGAVRELDGFIFGFEAGDWRNRAEDFLAHDRHVVPGFEQYGRFVEGTLARWRLATGQRTRAAGERLVHQARNIVACPAVNQRAEFGAILHTRPDLDFAHRAGKALGKFRGHCLVRIEAVRGGAGLTAVAQLGDHRARHRDIEIGILADDERGIAAEFHRALDDILRRLGEQDASGARRACERELAHARILQHGGGDFTCATGRDHVHDTRRDARLGKEGGHRERGQRRFRRGLQHDAAAGRERRADLAGGHRRRKVPGRDEERYPHRLADHQHAIGTGGRGADLAEDAHRFFGEPAQELRRIGDFAARLAERLAVLQRDQAGERFLVLVHQVEGAAQHLGTLARCNGGPGRTRAMLGFDCSDAVGDARIGDARNRLLGCRVENLDPPTVRARSPAAVDIEVLADGFD